MDSEEWQVAWRIFDAARELPPAEQTAFVEAECKDPVVARQVFGLLSTLDGEEEAEFQETAILTPTNARTGAQIGRYQVAELLGRGGMGEVYAARDTELDRQLALKFLRPEAIGDPAAIKRFIREARAASALNHPNIVTIYEVLDSGAGLAIAMELVPGKPLNVVRRSTLTQSTLTLAEVVKIGSQAASALAAAHAQGVVHRDIKPENLMLRPDGLLKILDFGVARGFGPNVATGLNSLTDTNSGTLRYMSPEQLRGEPVTGASDIFSLGLVLYELMTSRHPFESEYAWETAYNIHSGNPGQPSTHNSEVPGWLDERISAMLNRDAALRPAAAELQADFSRERPASEWPASEWQARWRENVRSVVPVTSQPEPHSPKTSLPAVLAVLAALVLVTGAWYLTGFWSPWQLRALVFSDYPGDEDLPSFSPDGQKVVFAWNKTGWGADNFDLYIRQVGSNSLRRLTNNPLDDMSPAWSPDGKSIAFIRKPTNSGDCTVIIIPAEGGPEREIANLSMPKYHNFAVLAWTPDGKWLIAPTQNPEDEPVGLFRISPVDGTMLRLTRPPPGQSDLDPAISPDSHTMAFTRYISDSVFSIQLVPLDTTFVPTGEPQSLPGFSNLHVGTPQWTGDSQELLFAANPKDGMAIWRMRVPKNGEAPQTPHREEFAKPGSDGARSADIKIGRISATARRLIYSSEVPEINIWRVPLRAPGTSKPLPSIPVRIGPKGQRNSGARISPDGSRLVFESQRTGSTEIWTSAVDGSKPRQLTSFGGPVTGSPVWSPDGKRIAFDSRAEGRPDIYVIPATGGRAERITDVLAENYLPAWSRDGRWIYFTSSRSGANEVWRQPASGGPAEQLHARGRAPVESLDGTAVYYERLVRDIPSGWSLHRLTLATGEDAEVLPAIIDRNFALTPDGIYYVPVPADGKFTIQFLDLRTGASRLVARIQRPLTRSLSLAPDGSYLLYTQQDRWGHDLMLVENFR